MFDRAWLENELTGLIVQLHQIEGAIQVLQQMLAQLDGAEQQPAPDALTLQELQSVLPEGHQIDTERGIQPNED